MFIVKRHGGNSNHEWKTVLETEDKQKAEQKYNKIKTDLRQGTVVLLQDEKVIDQCYAGRNRTRW